MYACTKETRVEVSLILKRRTSIIFAGFSMQICTLDFSRGRGHDSTDASSCLGSASAGDLSRLVCKLLDITHSFSIRYPFTHSQKSVRTSCAKSLFRSNAYISSSRLQHELQCGMWLSSLLLALFLGLTLHPGRHSAHAEARVQTQRLLECLTNRTNPTLTSPEDA